MTAEQQREHVYAYVCLPHGSKARYLREYGLGPNDIRKWRAQVFAGSLELGLIPRGGQLVSTQESAALRRLLERLRRWHRDIKARDVFGAPTATMATARLQHCAERFTDYTDYTERVFAALHASDADGGRW